jgi:hypothetical protein
LQVRHIRGQAHPSRAIADLIVSHFIKIAAPDILTPMPARMTI